MDRIQLLLSIPPPLIFKSMKKTLFLILFFCLCLFTVGLKPAGAISLSPSTIEIKVEPGETSEYYIELLNESQEDAYLSGTIEVFEAKNETGEAEIVDPAIGYQAVAWIGLPVNSVALQPGEIIKVPVRIAVPKTADVGGYYLAIMWETGPGPKANDNRVGVSGRIGNLLFLSVGGQAQEELAIEEFKLTDDKNTFNFLPVNFSVRLKNFGNVHSRPDGMIIIKNMFGGLSQTVPLNPNGYNVLPQTIRCLDVSWLSQEDGQWNWLNNISGGLATEITQLAFGQFSAQVQLEYGSNKERVYSPEIKFWVIPWRLMTLIAVIIILLIAIKVIRHKLKKLNA